MKKVFLYIMIVGSVLSLNSCLEEISSEASLDASSKLAEDDVNKLLVGLYRKVRHPNSYGYFAVMATEIMADNYKPVKFQWFQVQNIYEHNVPSNDLLLRNLYVDFYAGIDRANTILKSPSANEDQKGKAKFYRAYTYLRLFDLFERVPIVDENYNRQPIAPSSKEDVLNFIIEDLKYGKENMVEFDGKNVGLSSKVPTKEAAAALLARVYRLKGDLAAAANEAEYVIGTNKFSIAQNPKERESEVITMLKGNKAEEAGSWGWIMSYESRTWNCFAAADDLLNLISDNDTRRALFDFDKKDERNGYVFSNKYKTQDNSDLLVVRIPEMYLISAEAGNTNRLRELQNIRNSTLSLEDERRLEMSFEWTRWQDLKLSKKQDYVLPYPQQAVDSNPLLK